MQRSETGEKTMITERLTAMKFTAKKHNWLRTKWYKRETKALLLEY